MKKREKPLLRRGRLATFAGDGLLDRIRSTGFALLGATALFGLVIVAIMSQQGVPFLPALPLPGSPGGEPRVSEAALAPPGGDHSPAPASSASGSVARQVSVFASLDTGSGEQTPGGVPGTPSQIGVAPASGPSQVGQPVSPGPAPTVPPVEPGPVAVPEPVVGNPAPTLPEGGPAGPSAAAVAAANAEAPQEGEEPSEAPPPEIEAEAEAEPVEEAPVPESPPEEVAEVEAEVVAEQAAEPVEEPVAPPPVEQAEAPAVQP